MRGLRLEHVQEMGTGFPLENATTQKKWSAYLLRMGTADWTSAFGPDRKTSAHFETYLLRPTLSKKYPEWNRGMEF
jgi:hypothetical protein